MKPAQTVVAVVAALAVPLSVTAPAVAQETPTSTDRTDAAAEMADAVEAECAAITAVIPVPSSHEATAPTGTGSGLFTDVVNPVAGDGEAAFEPIFIPYQARGEGDDPAAAYSQTLTDGYARLTQVSHRVISQCPDTKLALLGQGQGGHLVSVFAAEIGKGSAAISDESVAFAATISDPTRAAGQTLFPGVPGQSAPVSWTGTNSSTSGRTGNAPQFSRASSTAPATRTSSRTTSAPRRQTTVPEQETSVKLYADLATVPAGSGLNHQAQQIEDYGSLTGRVAQICVTGDLSCSAPTNAALGRAALSIMEHAGTDFSGDPLAAANAVSQSLTATAASGVARSASQDWQGDTVAALAPTGEYSVSERIEQAATPRIRTGPQDRDEPSTVEDSVAALNRAGSIGINAATTVAGDVLDEATIGALLEAGITGGATSPALTATLGARAGASALKLIQPRSLGPRLVSVFEALTSNITDNAELPELIAAARTWDRLANADGYRTVPISMSGESATEVLADWLAAAVRDNTAAPADLDAATSTADDGASASTSPTTATSSPEPAPAPQPRTQAVYAGPRPTDTYLRDQTEAVIPAGPAPKVDAYELTTVASETGEYGGAPVSVAEASARLVSGNADYTAAQRLAFLADPAYPVDSPLAGVTQAGAHVAIAHGRS